MLYWPGDSPPLVASEAAVAEMPADLSEPPRVVNSVAEILEAVENS